MIRLLIIAWACLGALALGITVVAAARRKKDISGWWYLLAILLGPIYFFFILPIWIGKWGEAPKVERHHD